MTRISHVVCPHCGGVNRIPAGKPAGAAKCGACRKPLFTGRPTPVSLAAFDKHVTRNDIPVVVDFWAAWCGPCRAMAPVFERLAGELEPDVRFLNVDTDREPKLATRYGVRSIPTLMLFRGGDLVAQSAGAMDAASLRTWLRQNLAPAA